MSQNRGMFMGFAGILTVGFALSGWYVGQRILAADAHPAAAALISEPPQIAAPPETDNVTTAESQQEPADPIPDDDGTNIYGLPASLLP